MLASKRLQAGSGAGRAVLSEPHARHWLRCEQKRPGPGRREPWVTAPPSRVLRTP